MTALLVVVPCHNEERVIERKLRDLARAAWPASERPHRVVVVDDGSTDATAERARALVEELFGISVLGHVVANGLRPGKSGAITRALDLRDGEDLIVLTDADVVFEPRALVELARAFERRPRLGMACGAQRFVDDLEGARAPASGAYDRITAAVRAIESAGGRLVSVHGQLLAWRAELDLVPTPGMAADDLDLMLQARGQGVRIERVPAAVFVEARPGDSDEREAQALRRARAYVQFLDHPGIAELSGRGAPLDRLQGLAYRTLPTAAPWLVPVLAFACVGLASWAGGAAAGSAMMLLLLAAAASPLGRRLIALLGVIAAARRSEAAGGMKDRWETARH